jgi:hypothetical protein
LDATSDDFFTWISGYLYNLYNQPMPFLNLSFCFTAYDMVWYIVPNISTDWLEIQILLFPSFPSTAKRQKALILSNNSSITPSAFERYSNYAVDSTAISNDVFFAKLNICEKTLDNNTKLRNISLKINNDVHNHQSETNKTALLNNLIYHMFTCILYIYTHIYIYIDTYT